MKNKKYIQWYLAGLITLLGVGGVFANSVTLKTYLENIRNTESGQVGYILGEIFYGSGSIKEGKIKQQYLDLEGLSGGSSGGGVTSVNTKTGVVLLSKADIGLGNVENTSDILKNVLSATKLTLARTINGIAFDGSANITLPTVNTSGNQTIGGLKTFTGNVAGITPVANDHFATKAYVDTVAVASAGSANSSNLQAAGTFFNTGGNPFYCQQTSVVANPGYKYAQVANIGKICDQSDVNNIKLCSLQGACSDGSTTLKVMDGTGTLSTGYDHACAVREDGKILCWGANNYGQLGDGTSVNKAYATLVSGSDNNNFIGVTAGNYFTCGLKNDGKVWCWGYNNRHQLGDGTNADKNIPTLVSGVNNTDFIQISAGGTHTCGLKSNGAVWCWGRGDLGSIGTGGASSTYPLTIVSSATVANSGYIEITSGQFHSCGRKTTGAIVCWGYNNNGQIGISNEDSMSYYPYTKVGSGYKKVFAFGNSTCALSNAGQIHCMGQVISTNGYNLVNPSGGQNNLFNDLGTIGASICGIRADGGVYCNVKPSVPEGITIFSETAFTYTLFQTKRISPISNGNSGNNCFQNSDNTISCYGAAIQGVLGSNQISTPQGFKSYVITPN